MASSVAYVFVYSEADRWGRHPTGGGGDDEILVNDVCLAGVCTQHLRSTSVGWSEEMTK